MLINEFNWTTPDNINIYAKEWKIESPKAVIALVHGLGEHCNRYNHLADYFAQYQIAMIGYDRRGHGKSGGKRGHTPNYGALLEEVDTLLIIAKESYSDTPIFLYGHSLGGNISLNYVLKKKPDIQGLISSGAFIEFPAAPPALLITIGKIMRRIYPKFTQNNNVSPQFISSDKQVVEGYISDPLVHNRITSATGMAVIEAANWLKQYSGAVSIPILLMHGNQDKLTGFEGSKNMATALQGDIVYKEWDGFYHEIHNEPGRREVFDYTRLWIEKKL